MNHEKRMVKILEEDGYPIISMKQDRNAKCGCGSGKKAKNCHGNQQRFYSSNPNPIVDQKTKP